MRAILTLVFKITLNVYHNNIIKCFLGGWAGGRVGVWKRWV